MTIPSVGRRTPPTWTAWRFTHPDLDDGVPGVSIGPLGRIDMVQDAAAVRQSLVLLLSTRPGERVMRPDFGCDLHRLVFAPNDNTAAGLAMQFVRQAVERFEPRAAIIHIDAGPAPDAPDLLEIVLDYRPRLGGAADRLVVTVPLQGGA